MEGGEVEFGGVFFLAGGFAEDRLDGLDFDDGFVAKEDAERNDVG